VCRDISSGRRLWSQECYVSALADEEDRSHQSVEQDSWGARGCRKCKKHAEGERKCIKNGARCGMGVWDGNKSRVERLERQGLACQWTIREGI
jgi:hypothetical protein